MNRSPRERLLLWIAGIGAVAVVAYVFVAMLVLPLLNQRKANVALAGENDVLKSEYDSAQKRNRAVMAEILPRSLPADLDLSKREYESALGRLLRESKVPAGFTVLDKGADNKGIPELVKGRPAYTKIAYTITMSKVDIATVMLFLKKYYDLNLLHQITTFTLKRDESTSIATDPRAGKDRTDLKVTLVTEALILDGAPNRKTLLSAPVSAGSLLGGMGLFALENTAPELGRGIAPYMLGQILATPGREYAYVTARDVLHGPLPPLPEPKAREPEPDISPFIRLVTLVKSSDGTAHVEIFDQWNNYDFEINIRQKGEKLIIEAMRYLKTKKSDFYPDGRMKDRTFPKEGNLLAFSDEKSSTKHVYKIYGIDGTALILGETDAKSAAKTEKFYRWEVGAALKAIKELKAADAQEAIRRASGSLLDAATPAMVPVVPMPVSAELAPNPTPAGNEGK